MNGPRILLVVGGGIAAYKACELVRTIRKEGGEVTCVLTEAGTKFVTPMALAALSEKPVYTTLWDLKNEAEMGHIQLSREADLVVICPATADLIAKMASGIADDLATTMLLATDKPVMVAPAMNVRMWQHAATMRNVQILREAGVDVMEPDEGSMACGEFGPGRLPDPEAIWQRIAWALGLDPVEVAPLPGSVPEPYPHPALPQTHRLPEPEPQPDPAQWQPRFDEPEPEPAAPEGLGLGGLTGSMISRGLQRAKKAITFGQEDEDPASRRSVTRESPSPAASLLVAKKGAARAAPPTDPAAINHLFSHHADAAPPESFGEAPAAPLPGDGPLKGRHVLVTAGPTWEPIDPVRYIANRSSGKQGFAIAAAAARAGARVTLVAGPVHLETPPGVDRVDVESALQMAEAVKKALPADIAVMVAAVADWRTANIAKEKLKKRGSAPPALLLTENPDILAGVAARPDRPPLLIGFAAETEHVIEHAKEKRKRKGADWIIANDVSGDVMGGDANAVHIVRGDDVISLPEMPKEDVARILVERMADAFAR
ncbi:bifunctional phosphopantothenoylcysteine decarboxylase/phosphopantothenate synthase [Novosphingobium mangrovi (ex Huang et al. 2023)]|uniref:Coenzyme A biosynthesis bifunctional protein CoaBC n=1 Tax=Novosphingobium mangrovi (ex Huang et al. 2023) TaxID=2976432 RepID=A0ABT2I2P2_9SPHN|nr:bifunctional phosphopantothenoylcysteine decarboxylase/phosphopantothenate synthase [Novosphingobium mangrovi (ex Huang et al. 2023)]MCT2399061.1 bifunctional phosphopantothenoylcysteine decarboxylase/phosphopantothenate synthase [Novosphingobium mangrovi (ex Huang et al. 2023)]